MKERTTITIDKKLLKELDLKRDNKKFANRSHGIGYCITKMLEND